MRNPKHPKIDNPFLKIGPNVTALPIVHGSGDFAWEVRRLMNSGSFDCLAVPLPASFQPAVEQAILDLPAPGVVIQRAIEPETPEWLPGPGNENDSDDGTGPENGSPDDSDGDWEDEGFERLSYVPIDPCQPVIAALRTAMGERMPRRFIDLETNCFEVHSDYLPDPYALKKVPLEQFSAAVVPHLSAPDSAQWHQRMAAMAWQLRELSVDFRQILFVTNICEWPWIRQAFLSNSLQRVEHEEVEDAEHFQIDPETLYFLFGELPFITNLYERARSQLEPDGNLSIDGIKELLIASRDHYRKEFRSRARNITPKLLSQCLKYIRNLTLMERYFTPQLATIVTAAKQIAGDGYAMHVLETAKAYEFRPELELPSARIGINEMSLPGEGIFEIQNRLPGPPIVWKSIKLTPRPDQTKRRDWKQSWTPASQCSWPPEDERVENFRQTVFDRAKQVMGQDLAKTEKFTSSIKDGIDIRDTVRHWYDGDIYVKVLPPNRGNLDCAVMLFDSPADPRDYPWRTTWFAEHQNESTLAFFATDFRDEPVGPGICHATYGGALFLYPPIGIPDIWSDRSLDFTTTLEERLLAAACKYSSCPHIALVSPGPPGRAWRFLAKRYKKTWVHLPLSRFSDQTIQQLRIVHVLNGKQIRSYAADFIRRS